MGILDETADSTAPTNQEEEIVNDLDTLPSEDEFIEGEAETTTEEKVDEKDAKISGLERKLNTANRKYEKLTRDIEKLRSIQQQKSPSKERPLSELTEEERKDRQAQEYIDKRVEMKLKEQEEARIQAEEAQVASLSAELDEVLLENEDLTEKQVLDYIEEIAEKGISLSPTQAAALIKDGFGKKKTASKPKPKLPASKRGSGKVDLSIKKEKGGKELTYQEKIAAITRKGKEAIRGQR